MRLSAGIRTLVVCAMWMAPSRAASAGDDAEAEDDTKADDDAKAQDEGKVSEETDFTQTPSRPIVPNWTEYDLGPLTFRWGIFTLLDWGNAVQGQAAEDQLLVEPGFKVRDFRFTFGGAFATKRPFTYTMGLMYDGLTNEWFIRETGIQIGVPELWGSLFVGRQKEGISLAKATTGYAVWTMERTPFTDATIPILADGVKWLGGLPNHRANWNVAYYYNDLLKGPSKDWYDTAFVARVAVLPIRNDATGTLLHLGLAYHRGVFSDGEAELHARPEQSTAPYFLDTGTFPADHDDIFGGEVYYRNGSWFSGAEYYFDAVRAPQVGDPVFHGGNVFVSWLITGEQRPYIDVGGKAGFVKPARSAYSGGPGAWEAVLNFSYADFDSQQVSGGTLWRLTPEINWYIDDMTSFRVNYGVGWLDRFGTVQPTQFFAARFEVKIQ